jgi:outer membrane protein assembly factor BamB
MLFAHIRHRILAVAAVTIAAAAPGLPLAGGVLAVHASTGEFNANGNLLITDQFNNRAVEINPATGAIVWSFGSGDPTRCNPGPGTIIGLNDAERLSGGLTLMVGTGVPKKSSPVAPGFSCVDNRTIVVDQTGNIVWQYGQAGVTGSGPNQLNVPVFAIQLPNHNIMIVDQGNNRVIEVGKSTKPIVWSYPTAAGVGSLNNPNSVELLTNGNVLIADENNNRVIEVTRAGQIVWQYGSGDPAITLPLDFAAFASRLPNGNTLITDSGHSRIVEVTQAKQVVFEYFTNTAPNSNPSPLPTNAVRLKDGNTAIADQFNHRVLIIDPNGALLFQYGVTNDPGFRDGELDGPYTAFSIGDYTGQTVPPSVF